VTPNFQFEAAFAAYATSEETSMRKSVLLALSTAAVTGVAIAQTAAPQFVSIKSGHMLSSNVVNVDIYDTSNNDIGTIKDVAFDSSKNLKAYIVSVGGFLGLGTRYVAVDPASVKVKYDTNDKKWHANMNATKDELKNAPEFKYEGEWNASKS
jgi:sporulation protein YlmC with PRC-barrel domain